MAAPSNNSIKGLVPPTVVVDAVIYPRTRKGIYPVTVSVQQEWRFQHGLFKQDIVQAVLNSHCCAPNALDQELICSRCASRENVQKLVFLEPPDEEHVAILSYEKGEPRELYSFRARGVCTSSSRHLQTHVVLVVTFPIQSQSAKCVSSPFQLQSKPEYTPKREACVTKQLEIPGSVSLITRKATFVVRVLISSTAAIVPPVPGLFLANQLAEGFQQYHHKLGIIGQRACILKTSEFQAWPYPKMRLNVWVVVTAYRTRKGAQRGIDSYEQYLRNSESMPNPLRTDFLAGDSVGCLCTCTSI